MILCMYCSWNLRGMVHDSLQCSYSNRPSGTKQWIATFFINGPMMLVIAKNGVTTSLNQQDKSKKTILILRILAERFSGLNNLKHFSEMHAWPESVLFVLTRKVDSGDKIFYLSLKLPCNLKNNSTHHHVLGKVLISPCICSLLIS